MTDAPDLPKRGELWLAALGAGRPGEPGKTRPVLVLTPPDRLTSSSLDLVATVPLSSSLSPTTSRPSVHATARNGLTADSVLVVRAVRALALRRFVRRLGAIEAYQIDRVCTLLAILTDCTARRMRVEG